jgi:predicted GTPase
MKEEGTSQQMARLSFADASIGKLENKTFDATKTSKEIIAENESIQGSQAPKVLPAPGHVTDFPSYHPIKLCVIGRAFSGKSTQVKYLQKILGEKV